MKVLVSACLLGRSCKYNGGNNWDPRVAAFLKGREVVAVCPEVLAGMGVPRVPMELRGGRLVNRDGVDVDEPNRRAVAAILEQLRGEDIECAVLKSRSPTCGVRQVYDGTFSGTLTEGMGILARALADAGYRVIDAEDLPEEEN